MPTLTNLFQTYSRFLPLAHSEKSEVKDLNKNSLQVIFYVDAHYRKQLISFEKTLNLNIA